ncbi:hypothetical protein BDV06DRAFT_228356 [Aspergillus oleicola]
MSRGQSNHFRPRPDGLCDGPQPSRSALKAYGFAPPQVEQFNHVQPSTSTSSGTSTATAQTTPATPATPDIPPFHREIVWISGWDPKIHRDCIPSRDHPTRIFGGYPCQIPSCQTKFDVYNELPAFGVTDADFINKAKEILRCYGFAWPLDVEAISRFYKNDPELVYFPTVTITMEITAQDKRNIEFAIYDCLIQFQLLWGFDGVSVGVVDPLLVPFAHRIELERIREAKWLAYWEEQVEREFAGYC